MSLSLAHSTHYLLLSKGSGYNVERMKDGSSLCPRSGLCSNYSKANPVSKSIYFKNGFIV